MKVIYDKETDTLSLILRSGKVAESDEPRPGLILDYDKAGRLLAVVVYLPLRNRQDALDERGQTLAVDLRFADVDERRDATADDPAGETGTSRGRVGESTRRGSASEMSTKSSILTGNSLLTSSDSL